MTADQENGSVAFSYRLLVTLVLLALFIPSETRAEPPKHWLSAGYAYETEGSSLERVLQDFAHAFNVKVEFSSEMEQIIKGKIKSGSAIAFLERLALQHKFQWFVFNNTLYISAGDDRQIKRIKVKQLAAGSMKTALNAIGLIDKRFGWGELPSEKVVLVSGPQKYVELIQQLATGRKTAAKQTPVLAYQIQYASVEDRTIRYRDRTITIPGLARVLSGVLSGHSARIKAPQESQSVASEQTQTKTAGEEAIDKFRSMLGSGQRQNKVTADVRTNQILIHDSEQKRELYQGIIDELDVPLQLLEINALIVDINKEQLHDLGINWLFADTTQTGSGTALLVRQLSDFMARLYALEAKGNVSITSSPSVMTQENYPAVIDLSQSIYQTVTGERVAEFQKVTAGTSLQVISRVITDDPLSHDNSHKIQLVVDIEDGKLLPQVNNNISVQVSSVSTQATIHAGNALVLGGFSLLTESQNNRRIPYLADIPVLGNAFTRKTEEVTHLQRFFVLIPKIISPTPASVLPRKRRRLSERSIANKTLVSAFRQLAKGYIPTGFNNTPKPNFLTCDELDNDPNKPSSQWLDNDEFKLAIIHTTDKTEVNNLVNTCFNAALLAFSHWPPLPLSDGQTGELYVAFKPRSSY